MNFAQLSVLAGAFYGLTGVVLGAFAAHALGAQLATEMLAVWKTAVEYQLVHALALLLVGLLALQRPSSAIRNSGLCFGLGVALFSGSLYALALLGSSWIGAITPLGGLLLLAGWAQLIWAALRHF